MYICARSRADVTVDVRSPICIYRDPGGAPAGYRAKQARWGRKCRFSWIFVGVGFFSLSGGLSRSALRKSPRWWGFQCSSEWVIFSFRLSLVSFELSLGKKLGGFWGEENDGSLVRETTVERDLEQIRILVKDDSIRNYKEMFYVWFSYKNYLISQLLLILFFYRMNF